MREECLLNRVYSCVHPDCDAEHRQLMSLPELKYHLEFECQHTLYQCKRCTMKINRKLVRLKHEDEECIGHLKAKVEQIRKIKKENDSLECELRELKEKAKKQEQPRQSIRYTFVRNNDSFQRFRDNYMDPVHDRD